MDQNASWGLRLWAQLDSFAKAKGQSREIVLRWPAHPEVRFHVRLSNGKPRVVVDERLLALVDGIDVASFLPRLKNEQDRARWPTWVATVRASRGSTISLAHAANTIGAPIAGWVTLAVDIYQALEFEKDSLRAILPPERMAKVDAESRLLTMRRLAEILGVTTGDRTDTPKSDSAVPKGPEGTIVTNVREDEEDPISLLSRNVIFFGPPGTGKSHQLDDLVRNHLGVKREDHLFRITFHPEYSYFDFVGNYRPTVGWLFTAGESEGVFRPEAAQPHKFSEPRIYYVFDPGPLSLAIKAAALAKGDENVVLVIEEINRGNCAAIFGDVFQLLDRRADVKQDDFGVSQYAINPTGAWAAWLDENLPKESPAWKNRQLRLPRNLFIYATMNTSDQNLFPMDTAFRRRWSMEYVGVDEGNPPTLVPLTHDEHVPWSRFMKVLNAAIVEHTRTDDKQMGPWFVRARDEEHRVEPQEFASKVLFYLWADVFRDAPEKIFRPDLRTYDQLVRAYLKDKSLVFQDAIAKKARPESSVSEPPVAAAAAGPEPSPTDSAS